MFVPGFPRLRGHSADLSEFDQFLLGYFTPALGAMLATPSRNTTDRTDLLRVWRERSVEDERLPPCPRSAAG